MSGGLPAFGLGGVFYLLLIVWMVLRACAGGSRGAIQWAFIGKMSLMGVVMITVIAGEWILLREAVEVASVYVPSLRGATPTVSIALLLYSAPFILLGLIIGFMHILRLWVKKRVTYTNANGTGDKSTKVTGNATEAISS